MEWDDTVNELATINDIDPQAVQYFVKHAVMANRMPNAALTDSVETILKNVDVMTPDGKLKNAAIILFGTKPSSFFTATEFKAQWLHDRMVAPEAHFSFKESEYSQSVLSCRIH